MENLGKFKKGDAVKLHGGSYLITDLIGSGAVGEVYRAIDVQRRQHCAVKYNYGNYSSNRKLFYEKLLLLTQGRAPHPAFAWPYDAGDRGNNGSFLLAMPLKEGYGSLAPVMRGEAGLSPAQRLALARTLAHPRPVLVLDDPFSALDRSTEDAIFAELQAYARDKVVFLISHRLYHFPQMQQIIFMEGGRTTVGTHEELMAEVPVYRQLYESQTGLKGGEGA